MEIDETVTALSAFGKGPLGSFPAGLAAVLALPLHQDTRGALQPLDFEALPFVPRRVFSVAAPADGARRGGHAHRRGRQILVCLAGAVDVTLRSPSAQTKVRLTPDGHALLIEPGVWAEQHYQPGQSLLLVLSSEPYDPDDYLDGSA